jgi:hypothetical protein
VNIILKFVVVIDIVFIVISFYCKLTNSTDNGKENSL